MQPQNPNQYWLIRTRQIWKLGVFMILMLLDIIIFFVFILATNKIWKFEGISVLRFDLLFMLLGFGSLVWFTQVVKCPSCGYKPVWPILRSAPASEWLRRIVKLQRCPSCEDG